MEKFIAFKVLTRYISICPQLILSLPSLPGGRGMRPTPEQLRVQVGWLLLLLHV